VADKLWPFKDALAVICHDPAVKPAPLTSQFQYVVPLLSVVWEARVFTAPVVEFVNVILQVAPGEVLQTDCSLLGADEPPRLGRWLLTNVPEGLSNAEPDDEPLVLSDTVLPNPSDEGVCLSELVAILLALWLDEAGFVLGMVACCCLLCWRYVRTPQKAATSAKTTSRITISLRLYDRWIFLLVTIFLF
jgi:hypothetical protein